MSAESPSSTPITIESPQMTAEVYNGHQVVRGEDGTFMSKQEVGDIWQGQIDAATDAQAVNDRVESQANAQANRESYFEVVAKATEANPNDPHAVLKASGLSNKKLII